MEVCDVFDTWAGGADVISAAMVALDECSDGAFASDCAVKCKSVCVRNEPMNADWW